jgi:hypothetical protein
MGSKVPGRRLSKRKRRRGVPFRPAQERVRPPWGELCPNGCGGKGPHFAPGGLGSPGMFVCDPLMD